MHQITRTCVLVLWIQTVALVQSQECTLQEYLNSPQFDPNLNTTSLKASYPDGAALNVSCNEGYGGFSKLLCIKGGWVSLGRCQQCTLQEYLNGPLFDPNLNTTSLKASYPDGAEVSVGCDEGYAGFSKLLCIQGEWVSLKSCHKCTLQEYLNGPLFDPNLNITSLTTSDPKEAKAKVGCNEGYAGFVGLWCIQGEWISLGKCQQCTLQEYLNGPLFNSNLNTTSLKTSYPSGAEVKVGCNEGYAGFFHLTCFQGEWLIAGHCLQPSTRGWSCGTGSR